MVAKHAHFEGHVQGVGFRYATKRIAQGFDVCGWVRNLPDGRVELLIQGDSAEVDDFLSAIQESSLGGNIRDIAVVSVPPSAEIRGFMIR